MLITLLKTMFGPKNQSRASSENNDEPNDNSDGTSSLDTGDSGSRRGSKNGSKSMNGHRRTVANNNNKKQSKFNFKYCHHVKEQHGQPIFGVAFNGHLESSGRHVFAVTGSNKVSIYECMEDGQMQLLQTFADPDKEENFYCCVWTYDDETFDVILIAAGARGIIRIITPSNIAYKQLKGHGLSINDLKIHPLDGNLLLSISKDHSLRLWNIKTHTCIAIFGGVEGHRDEVLSADFHKNGKRIISCGMDHSLKIWSLDTEELREAIKLSYTYNHVKDEKPFNTIRCHFPSFTTRDIHRNYVDCVSWWGNFVLSKSCENCISCWKPGKLESDLDSFIPQGQVITESTTTFIHSFDLKDSEIWFMRFSMDRDQKTIALGNMIGKTYVWDIDKDDPDDFRQIILGHAKCTTALRQTCLSGDGSILICVSDDSSIWRWDREPSREQ